MDNTNEEVVQLYLDDIIPNRFQPREVFDDQALKELAVSIREHGVIQPILVRKFGEKYEIIAGERRYKASTMAGLTKIPAIIKNLDDKEASKVALIENLQRRDLTPVEEARTYQKILDLDQMTQEQLAKTMGKSQSAVSNKLRLLTLPDEVQEALLNNKISERHARSLLNAPKSAQVSLLKEVIEKKMTVRDLDMKIKEMTGNNESDSTSGGVTTAPVQDNNFLLNSGGNEMNNFDPTAVDINKIREQSVDINSMNAQPVQSAPKNIDSLLSRAPAAPVENRFIPDNKDTTIEKTEDGNEIIGNGLLAGMPVIQETQNNPTSIFSTPVVDTIQPAPVPAEQPMPATQPVQNDINSLFSTPAPEQVPIENNVVPQVQPQAPSTGGYVSSGNSDYGFNLDLSNIEIPKAKVDEMNAGREPQAQPAPVEQPMPATQPVQNDINSLFSTPAPVQVPIENNVVPQVQPQAQSTGGYVSSGNSDYGFNLDLSNIEIPKAKVDEMNAGRGPVPTPGPTIDVTVGVNEVKNLVASLTAQGYSVTVDELNLDNEVQLVVKFNKG